MKAMINEAMLYWRLIGKKPDDKQQETEPSLDLVKRRKRLKYYIGILKNNQNALKEALLMKYKKDQIEKLCQMMGVDHSVLMYGKSSKVRFVTLIEPLVGDKPIQPGPIKEAIRQFLYKEEPAVAAGDHPANQVILSVK